MALGGEDNEEQIQNETLNPFAPESFGLLDDDDESTTVDPSYIISLIRNLLPHQENELNRDFEESGCILWDLAAAKTQAEFMVNNFLLEVLLANLHSSESFRIKEICLGIIGNLACHDTISNKISSEKDLIETIIQQLFLDDSPCLTETFRVLEAGVQSSEYIYWANAILKDDIIERILWIFANTLNFSLLEKCVNFLLAIIENEQVGNILMKPLIKLGLNNIAVNLFISEIEKSGDENKIERSEVLDIIISLVEALSAVDGFLNSIEFSEKLLKYLCKILKIPDKFEVSSYYASAVLIIANLLSEEKNLVLTLLNDISFIETLFDAIPLLPNDLEAKNAILHIISTLFEEINENKISNLSLNNLARVLISKCDIIEEYMANNFEEICESYLKTCVSFCMILWFGLFFLFNYLRWNFVYTPRNSKYIMNAL